MFNPRTVSYRHRRATKSSQNSNALPFGCLHKNRRCAAVQWYADIALKVTLSLHLQQPEARSLRIAGVDDSSPIFLRDHAINNE